MGPVCNVYSKISSVVKCLEEHFHSNNIKRLVVLEEKLLNTRSRRVPTLVHADCLTRLNVHRDVSRYT